MPQKGTPNWPLRGEAHCSFRAPRPSPAELPAEVLAAPEPFVEGPTLPTIDEEIARLVASRRLVERFLDEHPEQCGPTEVVRYLGVLAQVARSLSVMLLQRASTGGADEIERFFEQVARRVQEQMAGPPTPASGSAP